MPASIDCEPFQAMIVQIRSFLRCLAAPAVLTLVACASAGASQLVSATEFSLRLAEVGRPQSMHDCRYLGTHGGFVYLEVASMNSTRHSWTRQKIHARLRDLEESAQRAVQKLAAAESSR